MMVRGVNCDEVAQLCASRDALTFVSESAQAYASDRFGVSTDSTVSAPDRRVYLKGELTMDIPLLERLCNTQFNDTVIGIGTGWLCDIAKIVGRAQSRTRSGVRTVLVPSALTQNGPFTHKAVADERFMALTDRPGETVRRSVPKDRHSVVTGFPDEVWICHELLERPGNARFNRAGLGDPLSSITGVFDNELAHRAITEPEERQSYQADLHPDLNDEARIMVSRIGDLAPEISANTREGINITVDALRASARWHYHAQRLINGGEHSFAHTAEEIIRGKGLLALHGELLCIGILCMLHLQNRADEIGPTRELLASLKLPVDHASIGLTKGETIRALHDAVDCRPDKYGILNTIRDSTAFERAVSEVFNKALTDVD